MHEAVTVTSCCLLCVCPGCVAEHVKTHLSLAHNIFPFIHSLYYFCIGKYSQNWDRLMHVVGMKTYSCSFRCGVWETSREAHTPYLCVFYIQTILRIQKHREHGALMPMERASSKLQTEEMMRTGKCEYLCELFGKKAKWSPKIAYTYKHTC